MKANFLILLFALFFLVACGKKDEITETEESSETGLVNVAENEITPPVFSHEGGFYSSDFDLNITAEPGTVIRFTVDGSTPTPSSPVFTAPLLIHSPEPTAENSPMSTGIGLVHFYRDWWWGPPALPNYYYNGMVVRARAFNGDGEGSETVTNSFFVERDGRGVFNTRVISITMEPEHFISQDEGMYYDFENRALRHISYVEIFSPNGELMLSQYALARVSGNWSRRHPKKSLRINFNQGDGIVYNMPGLIPDTRQSYYSPLGKVDVFKHLTMRISDWDRTTIRDTAAVLISEPLRPDIQNASFGAVFINGEFWGMYELREHRSDVHMAARYPGIDPASIVMIEHAPGANANDQILTEEDAFWNFRDPETSRLSMSHPLHSIAYKEGRRGFEAQAYESWMSVLDAIRFTDMSLQENYNHVKTLVDMDNLIDYFIIHYHFDNWDWPSNNFIAWRTETYYPEIPGGDTRWRFIAHDFDESMNAAHYDRTHHFTTTGSAHIAEPEWAAVPFVWAVDIFYNLFQSEEFRNTLAARYSTYASTVFNPTRANAIIDELIIYREPSMEFDFYRWHLFNQHSVENWAYGTNAWSGAWQIRDFINNRINHSLGHLRGYYNRTDRENLSLGLDASGFTNINWIIDSSMGFYDISGAQVRADLFDRNSDIMHNFNFTLDDFNADYIRGLPIIVTAIPYNGFEFSHFDVSGGITGTFTENPMIITPPPGSDNRIKVRAVFIE
ncbi:MAG: CotH kinase family protein [Defluviitaleaceae bacterium]|nr:CotH kinase family protein [Defluviitaleaceae bacterium]